MESLSPKASLAPSSWQSTQESDDIIPPAKRQRLSPSPTPPNIQSSQPPFGNSPTFSNITLPNGAFAPRTQNGITQLRGGSSTPGPTAGSMGPPQRPAERPLERAVDRGAERPEKPLDINDINDLVASSGINIREEEDFLYASYRSDRNNTSFRSESSQTISPNNSFDLLSRNNFGSLGTSHGSLQQPVTSQSQEEELYERHKAAARALNETHQHHMEDPFFFGATVRRYIEKAANENNIRIPVEGLFDRITAPKPETTSGAKLEGSDGTAIQAVKAPSLLNRGAPMDPILSLLSIAGNERLRGILEDAYGLARARRFGADGVVPPQFSDLAIRDGAKSTTTIPQSLSQSAWDDPNRQATPTDTQMKENGLPSPPPTNPPNSAAADNAIPTIEFPKMNGLTDSMVSVSKLEREAEEARLKVRATRRAKKAAQTAQAATSNVATPDVVSPVPNEGMLGEKAPEVAPQTKKEKAKAAAKDVSEEVATRNANITASMQLGGRKYNWLTGGSAKATPGTTTPAKKPAAQEGQDTSRVAKGADGGTGASQDKKKLSSGRDIRRFGEWREDGVGGQGVQLRDLVAVLGADGREQRTLATAYALLGEERKDGQKYDKNVQQQPQNPEAT